MKKFLFILVFISGCALSYKINRHYSQGEQVLIQKHDSCGRPEIWGEVEYQPSERNRDGVIVYKVKLRNGWIMTYPETFLDSLN